VWRVEIFTPLARPRSKGDQEKAAGCSSKRAASADMRKSESSSVHIISVGR
jgi:hypothetical protein